MPGLELGRGGRIELSLPRTNWTELERSVLKYEQLKLEKKATRSRIAHATKEKERLVEQHKRALTKWLRSGKNGKEPELTGIEKIDKELEACNLRLEAIEDAFDETEQELIAAVDDNRDEWAQEADERYRAALVEYAAVVEQLATVRAKVSAEFSLLYWVRHFPEEESHFRVRGSRVPALGIKQNGDSFTFHEVLEALRDDTNPVTSNAPTVIPWGQAATRMLQEVRDA